MSNTVLPTRRLLVTRREAMAMLGVPCGDAVSRAPEMARAQADSGAVGMEGEGGPTGLEDKQIVALVASLQWRGWAVDAAQVARSEA